MMPTSFWNPIPWLFLGAIITGWAGVLTFLEQAKDAREIKGWLTGGESYGYLEPLFDRQASGPGGLAYFIRHSGDYPLYDVSVRVQDAAGHDIQPVQLFGTLTSNSQWYGVQGLIFPASAAADGPREFRVEIIARNGVTVQRLLIRPDQGRWLTSSADIRRSARELLRPAGFPTEALQP